MTTAEFVGSAPSLGALPHLERDLDLPEVAFVGRSNVGKSSLIGALLQRKRLVKTSKRPGQTRAMNFFHVQVRRKLKAEGEGADADAGVVRAFYLVDLPGYGWAQMGHKEKLRLSALLSGYLGERKEIAAVCQLFDLRHRPTAEDQDVATQLAEMPYRHLMVATKADKLAASKRKPAAAALDKLLGGEGVTIFSSPDRLGRDALWERIWASLVPEPAVGAA